MKGANSVSKMPGGKAMFILPKSLKASISTGSQKKPAEQSSFATPLHYNKNQRWWMDEKRVNEPTSDEVSLLVLPSAPWFSQMDTLQKEESHVSANKFLLLVDQITSQLEKQYEKEVEAYNKRLASLGGNSDQKWLNNVIQSGTWSDRVAALTLRIQESPFHNLRALDILIEMASKKDPRVALMAIEALRDLLVNNILPDQPLLNLSQQPLLHSKMTMKNGLLMWYEAALKSRVVKVIQCIESCLQSNVTHFRLQALETAQDLISKKPEQESKLLEMIVNKTGDTEGKVNSKAFEMLNRLLHTHPAMKVVLIKEVRNFIYRPNTKLITIFRAINFLTNLKHRPNESDSVLQLAECYLSLFEKALSAKEEGSRLLASLLSGINRLFPLLDDVSSLFQYLDPIFKLIHTSPSWNTVTQALTLIANCVLYEGDKGNAAAKTDASQEQLTKRYYRALYSTLLTDQAMTNRKEKEYLNLLFRSIKNDPMLSRAMAFVKRLAISALHAPAPLAAALLFMISELMQARPQLKAMLTSADSEVADRGDDGSTVGDREAGLLGNYDAMKREPEFACVGGSTPVLHELALLRHHFHPSVKAFANALLDPPEHGISFSGDPLEEFGLMAFLNRFAYKNPKEKVVEGLRGEKASDPVNMELIQKIQEEEASGGRAIVAPEKHFFYKYFGEREALRSMGKSRRATRRRRASSDDSDEEDGGDDEEEMDNFADELAEGLMRSDAAGRGEFFDEDDDEVDDGEGLEGSDEDGDDVEDASGDGEFNLEAYHSSDDEGAAPQKGKASKKSKRKEESDDEEDVDNVLDFQDFKKKQGKSSAEDDDDDSEDDEDAVDFDGDDDSDEDGFPEDGMFFGDEDEDDDIPVQSSKKSKAPKRKREDDEKAGGDDDFADADMFADEMDEIIQRYALNPAALDATETVKVDAELMEEPMPLPEKKGSKNDTKDRKGTKKPQQNTKKPQQNNKKARK